MTAAMEPPVALYRVQIGDEPRLALGTVTAGPQLLVARHISLTSVLTEEGDHFRSGFNALPVAEPCPPHARLLAPVDAQPVWAAGVTFDRSRLARQEEAADGGDVYARVYTADRPELFFKAMPASVRASGQDICIRNDSTWNVPEPELGLLVDRNGSIRGYLLGNDVSSRSIEGENPLYLPQAKVYDGSCSLGPCIVHPADFPNLSTVKIELEILRDGKVLYNDQVDLSTMRREPAELVAWATRALSFPDGFVLLTGTSIVPEPEFTLLVGDTVRIHADQLGTLTNHVVTTNVAG
jgi:2-dehydro-3-deoxy-D-arabinonate dehydratase